MLLYYCMVCVCNAFYNVMTHTVWPLLQSNLELCKCVINKTSFRQANNFTARALISIFEQQHFYHKPVKFVSWEASSLQDRHRLFVHLLCLFCWNVTDIGATKHWILKYRHRPAWFALLLLMIILLYSTFVKEIVHLWF